LNRRRSERVFELFKDYFSHDREFKMKKNNAQHLLSKDSPKSTAPSGNNKKHKKTNSNGNSTPKGENNGASPSLKDKSPKDNSKKQYKVSKPSSPETSKKQEKFVNGVERTWGEWGGFEGEFGGRLGTLFLVFFLPCIPPVLFVTCARHHCAITELAIDSFNTFTSQSNLSEGFNRLVSMFYLGDASLEVWAGFFAWIFLQAILMIALPGKHCKGEMTPTGNKLDYKCNAEYAFIVSVLIFFCVWSRFESLSSHSRL